MLINVVDNTKETDGLNDGGNQAVAVGIYGLVATHCDAAIFPPGVSRTEPTLSLTTTVFESIRVIKPSTSRAPTHRTSPSNAEQRGIAML